MKSEAEFGGWELDVENSRGKWVLEIFYIFYLRGGYMEVKNKTKLNHFIFISILILAFISISLL